jgi:hypothetical protein
MTRDIAKYVVRGRTNDEGRSGQSRRAVGLQEVELARMAGVDASTVSRMEGCGSQPVKARPGRATAILSIPAAAHAVSAAPYTLNLGGIRSESTVGFKIVTGASVACIVSGGFVGTPTTA